MSPSTNCQDPECKATIVQPKTGRTRPYCDATCRKNAARYRAVIAWRAEYSRWEVRESERRAAAIAARDAWDMAAPPQLIGWQVTAEQAGWTPPGGWTQWTWDGKTKLYGPRPDGYRTPTNDPEPVRPPDYRMGRKTEYGW